MKYFMGPLSLRKRDAAVKSLVRRGHATDDELFEAQFGQWPVNGLSKDTDCSDIVNFKGFYKSKPFNPLSYPFRLAQSRRQDENDKTIYLNGLLLSPLAPVLGIAATRLAYARIHDLILASVTTTPAILIEAAVFAASWFSSYKYAIASSITKLVAPSLADIVGEEQIHLKQFKEDNRSIARAAHQQAAFDWMNNQPPFAKLKIGVLQLFDAVVTLMPRSYFSSDYELQARLHNIMVRGYPKWGKLPENKDELYLALKDMGIISPKIIDTYYKSSEFDPLKNTFNKHASLLGFFSAPSAEMNIGLNSFRNEEMLEMYWRDCLPALYGDLLVKYGDSNGLKKMGFGEEIDVLGLPIEDNIPPALPKPGTP